MRNLIRLCSSKQNCGKCIQSNFTQIDLQESNLTKKYNISAADKRKKCLIAKSLCQPSHADLDEPLKLYRCNIAYAIRAIIVGIQPTMLFVEHDQTFREHNCDKNDRALK